MEKLTEILSLPIVSAVGWTLIHATWQIAGLVLLYVGIKFITPKATVRYWSGLGLLFTQFFVSLITGFLVYQPTVVISKSLQFTHPVQLSFSEQISTYINAHIDLIFGLWAAGVTLLFVKLVANYLFTTQLKNSNLNKFNFQLIDLLNGVKERLNINRSVEIFETTAVTVPMIIGTLQPVILLPVAVVSGLSVRQLEIIIAHELAHLQRYDFALNILQSFVEILFFFHPALWFLSSEIRQEREYCCDETAVSSHEDRILLAKTLASIQENSRPVSLAMAFGKKKLSLLERVQRILGVNEKRSHAKESLWLMAGLVVVFMAFSQGEKVVDPAKKDMPIYVQKAFLKAVVADTVIKEKITINSNKNKVTIDGERIIVNGNEQELTREQKATLQKNYAAMKASEAKMNVHINEMEAKATEMGGYAEKLQANAIPMQDIAVKMQAVGDEMQKIVAKYEPRLTSKKTSIGEIEEISKKMGEEMKAYEGQMKELEQQMNAIEVQMDKSIEIQMQTIGKQMQIHEAPIEKYGEEMEGYMNEISKLLPDVVRKDIQNIRFMAPPPPPPPPVVRPTRPKQPPKVALPPPPPPIERRKNVPPPPPPAPKPPKPPIKN